MCVVYTYMHHICIHIHIYMYIHIYIVVVQSLSHVQLFVTPWTAAHQVSLPSTISQSLLKFMSIESMININIHAYIHTHTHTHISLNHIEI